jgi:predicted ArsR family transcriptional regulator
VGVEAEKEPREGVVLKRKEAALKAAEVTAKYTHGFNSRLTNKQKVLALVLRRDQTTSADVSEALGIDSTSACRLLGVLLGEGKIARKNLKKKTGRTRFFYVGVKP